VHPHAEALRPSRALAGRFLASLALLALALAARLASADAAGAPLSIERATRRAGDLVALGRAIEVDGDLRGVLVAIGGTVRIRGHVAGDAILLFAHAELDGAGRVDGDLLAIGGDLRFADGATAAAVRGRIVSVAALEAAFLAELATSPLRASSISPLLLSFRLLLLAGWLAAGLLLLFFGPRRLSAAARFGSGRLLLSTAIGLSAVLTGILLCAFLLAVVPAKPAFLAVALVVLALFGAKVFGLAAVFLLLGRRVARNAARGTLLFGDPSALALGLLVLGVASLVPAAGAVLWSVASLAGIGLALKTSFGRATA
jgi:hypothetical protein